ncbi:MAG: hypothetical protein MK133_05720, partial [Planctomycetes bacterium]|nr:hypothetical protein [Planctomycetota bacterium]
EPLAVLETVEHLLQVLLGDDKLALQSLLLSPPAGVGIVRVDATRFSSAAAGLPADLRSLLRWNVLFLHAL